MNLCFATNNQNKLREVERILHLPLQSLKDIGCEEELPETQDTLEGNALQKARYVFDKYHTPCFADDTGLEVEALGGVPGVYSARYAGPQKKADDNIRLLLSELEGKANRKARFRTVIALVIPDADQNGLPEIQSFEGVVNGRIIDEYRGDGGFGYDPVFIPDGYSRTFAEMDLEEKNKISHRGRAIEKLAAYLKKSTVYK